MEREELKKVVNEVLSEFFKSHRCFIVRRGDYILLLSPYACEEEIGSINKGIQEINSTMSLLLRKLESWAPQCSERDRIKSIQNDVEEIKRQLDKLIKLLLEEGNT